MSEHEHETETEQVYVQPCWRWSNWDIVGIGSAVLGGILSSVGQGFNLVARECAAAANYSRQNYELAAAEYERQEQVRLFEEHQARMAEELRDLVEGPAEDGAE